ncbi:hypothetical protein [Streptomyces sp. CRN 30]|uniref:hypothetical protein n=1 Tax=Streptomyces sp. CRN 30 TaxID=3075613 RepID=UPI002A805522|nr:hypothetical protein [Streptomyces sp. CRN 30]
MSESGDRRVARRDVSERSGGWPDVPRARVPRQPSASDPAAGRDAAAETRLIPEQRPETRPFDAFGSGSGSGSKGWVGEPLSDPAAETRLIPEQRPETRPFDAFGSGSGSGSKGWVGEPLSHSAAETRLIPEQPETRSFLEVPEVTEATGVPAALTDPAAGTQSLRSSGNGKQRADKPAPAPSGWPEIRRGKAPGTGPGPRSDTRASVRPDTRTFVDPDTRQLGRLSVPPAVPTAPATPHGSSAPAEDTGHTHDPHEVTVQMDVVGPQMQDWLVQQAKGAPGGNDSEAAPVFVDESGRRAGWLRRLGILVGVACAVYAVVIVATLLSGNSDAPWVPVESQEGDKPAGQVDSSPQPDVSADPSETADVPPQADPTSTVDIVPAPGTGTVVDPSDELPAPEASPDPELPAGGEADTAPSGGDQDVESPVAPTITAPSGSVDSPDASPEVTDSPSAEEAPLDGLAAGDRSGTAAGGSASRKPALAAAGTSDSPDSSPPENIV